jgi:hypothetical protein
LHAARDAMVATTWRTFMKLLLACAALLCTLSHAADPLPALQADTASSSVSGVSSGAYMAVQLHMSQGARFAQGVAAVAGGPFGCAEGSMLKAIGPCLGRSAIEVPLLVQNTQAAAQQGDIGPLSALEETRVYLFSGKLDKVVDVSTTLALQSYYQALLPRAKVQLQRDVPAAHGWVTEREGGACERMAAPHLLRCGFDLAGALLNHLLGPLLPRVEGDASGRLLSFDQTPFRQGDDLAWAGFLFIPAACEAGGCRVHVALHGCQMNAAAVGDAFARHSGLNAWAAGNRLLVLYPQTGKGAVNGCWDWWGYTGAGYLKRDAPQMKAIVGMLDRLSASRY